MTKQPAWQVFIFGIVLTGLGIGLLFINSLLVQVVGWVMILIASMVIFFAGYLGFNNLLAKISEQNSEK